LVALLSNGTLVNDNAISRFAEHRDRLLIGISLDASNPETHDSIRGTPGAFEKTLGTVQALIKKRLKVRVAMTVTPDNWREIEPTLLLAKEIGADWFGWSPAMPFGRGCGVEWDLTADELEVLSNDACHGGHLCWTETLRGIADGRAGYPIRQRVEELSQEICLE